MKKKNMKKMKPQKRTELSTPSIQIQCSNRWATVAVMFSLVFDLRSFENVKKTSVLTIDLRRLGRLFKSSS